MSRNRFEELLSNLHFANNETIVQNNRLGKVLPLVDILMVNYQKVFSPGKDIIVDETMVPWRGRLVFRQYIQTKSHKYGVKLFKLCSTKGYTWSLKIYSGRDTGGKRKVGIAESVCTELADKLLKEGRTLFVDNFYTSYELALKFLNSKTHVVGTIQRNKKNMPSCVMSYPLKKGEMVAREDPNGIVVLKWRDVRDVTILSTKNPPIMTPSSNSSWRGRPTKMKPLAISEYNIGKSGIDRSDQMVSYATNIRKTIKWYRKLAIYLLLGTTIVNAQYSTQKKKTVSPLGDPQKSAREACKKDVRTLLQKEKKMVERQQARKNLKKTTYCLNCLKSPQMCLDCFNEFHAT
ncbi:PREDICTED: piggyBac transposable element-derived protein 4-like [Polistes dominula]|uniref:PiggyBac transposable element-derived protein 4-like n=1 Tax=Polistes dominula TaxID=743375 RepID=A0ABM1JB43_POLDO|nr:PREDICTED: piggyBac transposable element-derived protein 4-like [Polistes dominula]